MSAYSEINNHDLIIIQWHNRSLKGENKKVLIASVPHVATYDCSSYSVDF